MSLELSGSRIVAPFLGSSLYVWTSLIGIILGCLSIGYYWGGALADRNPSKNLFAGIILAAACATALISVLQIPVLLLISKKNIDLRLGAVIATVVLFATPGVLLGMVTPFALRLKIEDVSTSGITAGRLYAMSTLGSIVGTFATGFFLLAFFGSTKILLFLALLLFCASILASAKGNTGIKVVVIAVLGLLLTADTYIKKSLASSGMIDIDTQYHRAIILDSDDTEDKRKVRILVTDPLGFQSMMYLDAPTELAGKYSKFYELAFHFKPNVEKTLLLGGGAYSYPKYFMKQHPDVSMDIVEIDPGLTDIAKKYFEFKPNDKLRIMHEDGRTFLNRLEETYDIIFIDVFASSPSLPFQLTTVEVVEHLHRSLVPDGLVLANIITGIEGKSGRFLRAEIATYKKFFPQIHLFAVEDPENGIRAQNVLLLAAKSETPLSMNSSKEHVAKMLSKRWQKDIATDMSILTDDYAPVEWLMLPVLNEMEKKLHEDKLKKRS